MRALSVVSVAAVAVLLATASAGADESLTRGLPTGTNVVGAGSLAAWWAPAPGGATVLVSHGGTGPAVVTQVTGRGEELDAGLDAHGRPTIIWQVGREVRAWRSGAPQATRLTTLPPGAILPVLWRGRLAYVRKVRGRRGRCQTPFLRDLRTRHDTALGRGRLCGDYVNADLASGWLSLVDLGDAEPTQASPRAQLDARATEDVPYDDKIGGLPTEGVLVVPLRGARGPRFVVANSPDDNFHVRGMALEGDRLYTITINDSATTYIERTDLRTNASVKARTFTALRGPFARAAGRTYTLVAPSNFLNSACGVPKCTMVVGDDPFTPAERLLPAVLTAIASASARTVTVTGRLTRERIKGRAKLGVAGVAGAQIEVTPDGGAPVAATTASDGTWMATLTAPPGPGHLGLAVRVVGDDPAQQPLVAATALRVNLGS